MQKVLPSLPKFTPICAALFLASHTFPVHAQVPWNLQRVNADVAHALGHTGQGVVVGVIDSGLDAKHPAFAGRIDPRSWNFLSADATDIADLDGHGTHVAGIIAAGRGTGPMYGVAPNASILSLRAIGDDEDDDEDDDLPASAKALHYAANLRLKVVNGSYGPNAVPPLNIDDPSEPGKRILNPDHEILTHQVLFYNEDLGHAQDRAEVGGVRAAAAADVLMVFAAGNEYLEQPKASANPSGNGLLPYIRPENHDKDIYRFVAVSEDSDIDINDPDTYDYIDPHDPRLADIDYSDLQGKLIAVVATDNQDRISSYSNRCGVAWQWCMAAPGGESQFDPTADVGILSTIPGSYGVMEGTSMAAPLVAGAAAVVRGVFPYLTASQTIEVMLTTTNTTGHLADRAIYGRGLLDLGRAVLGPREFGAEGFAPIFDVNTQGYNSVWSGDIIGTGGLTKRGAGTLALTGMNTYRGNTTITGGRLLVNGSIAESALTVEQDAALAGRGTLGDTRMEGMIAPGDPTGTLTVAGNYSQATTATFQTTLAADGSASQLHVRGVAALEGGALQINGITPMAVGKQYTLIQADGGLSGNFQKVLNDDYVFVALDTRRSAQDLQLSVDRKAGGFAAVGASNNQRAVARAVDKLSGGNAVFDSLILSKDPALARNALDLFSGDTHPSVLTALVGQSSITRDALLDRGRTQTVSGEPAIWGRYTGSITHIDSDGNAASLRNTYNGALFGADTSVSASTRLGMAAGFGSSSMTVNDRQAKAEVDNYTMAAYGNTDLGATGLRYGAAYSWHRIDSRRDTGLPSSAQSRAKYNANSAQAFIEVGVAQQLGDVRVEPFAGLAYVNTRAKHFQESGPAGLQANSSDLSAGFSTMGLRADTQWALSDQSTLGVQGTAGWRHAFGGLTPSTRMRWQDDAAFTVTGVPLARDALLVETGIVWRKGTHAKLDVSYSGQFGGRIEDHGVRVNASWKF